MAKSRVVAVIRSDCLPASETFIREQLLSYRSYYPILFGARTLKALPLDKIDVRLLSPWSNSFVGSTFFNLASALALVPPSATERISSANPTILHAHFGLDGVKYYPIAKQLNLPYFVTLHGFDITISAEFWHKSKGWFSRRYPERLLALGRSHNVHFVAVSHAIKEAAIAFGLPSERITVHYIGINPKLFSPGPVPIRQRSPKILFVGRFVEKKGGKYLIEAFRIVKENIPAASLTMIGSGPLLADLQRYASDANLQIEFTGNVSHSEVRRHLNEARVFCLPSVVAANGDSEGLPIVILEAQSCGVPTITSANFITNEGIRDQITGFHFPEKDVPALSTYLLRLLQDDELAERMSHAGPEFISSNFDIADCTSGLERNYDTVLADRRKTA